ncbi:MAG TPA: hypothetical protein VH701_18550 [Vicinamibacterales bacterium]|jgi:hypothetical protein
MRTILVLGLIAFASPVVAQDAQKPKPSPPAPQREAPEKRSTDTAPPGAVNAEQLGVSLDRIRLRFQRTGLFEPVFDSEKLKLSTYVDVVGKAPPLRLFGPDSNLKNELTSRAVPFGGPTHRDMLQVMTPQEFRTPAMDMTALFEWLSKQFDKDKKDE